MQRERTPSPRRDRHGSAEVSGAAGLHRVVVVGGGVAGLEVAGKLAKRARRLRIGVTLIDKEPAHIWKPMLHMIAAGASDVSQQETQYLAQAHRHGFTFVPGALRGVDRATRSVHLDSLTIAGRRILPERHVPFDTLILAMGSQANDFGVPGVRERCFTLDSRSQALRFNRELQARILQSIAENSTVELAVVGGGATGVELCAELIQLADMIEHLGAAGLRGRMKVTLLESGPNLLEAFPDRVRVAARARLERLGVGVLTGARVVAAECGGLRLADGSLVSAHVQVWAAGVRGSDVSFDDLEVTDSNRVVIDSTLQTTRDPAIFAIGDCASVRSRNGSKSAAPSAQLAHQQALHLVRRFPCWLAGKALPPFSFRDFGSIVSLGGYGAYGSLGRLGLFGGGFIHGRVAQIGHALLYRAHQATLHGVWRGGLLWLADRLDRRARIRVSLPEPEEHAPYAMSVPAHLT